MPTVATAGELLVELMRPEPGIPLDAIGPFDGPYPSGAPCIFIDTVRRLGLDAGIVGTVGADAFGSVVLDRLSADGVDTSHVRETTERSTGVAFVSYDTDGSRAFLFHLADAAAGQVDRAQLDDDWLDDCRAVHVSGSAVAINDAMASLCARLVTLACERELIVSFDPNVRPSLLGAARTTAVLDDIRRQADIITPTEEELRSMVDSEASEPARARALLEQGADLVAVTKGADGCTLYAPNGTADHPGFPAEEIDPTGAGDAFAAGVVVGTLEGRALSERAAFANAVGSLAVRSFGPMAGLPERADVDALLTAE